jgi:Recombination endonuclease VII
MLKRCKHHNAKRGIKMATKFKLWLNWDGCDTKADDCSGDREMSALLKFQCVDNDVDNDVVCAICGYPTSRWVKDHCHESGLIRGLLCSGCNTHEGMSQNPVYQAYRKTYPTKILKQKMYYEDYATGYPPKTHYTRKEVENIDSWTPRACFEAMKDFNEYRVSLDWLTRTQFNELLSKAIDFAAETKSKFHDMPSEDRILADSVANFLLGKK